MRAAGLPTPWDTVSYAPSLTSGSSRAAKTLDRVILINHLRGIWPFVRPGREGQSPAAMPEIRRAELRAELSGIDHDTRVRRMVELGRILRDALDAADLSEHTSRFLGALVLRIFARDTAWAATWLATLPKVRGLLSEHRLGEHLTEDEVRASAPWLLEVARNQARVCAWCRACRSSSRPCAMRRPCPRRRRR